MTIRTVLEIAVIVVVAMAGYMTFWVEPQAKKSNAPVRVLTGVLDGKAVRGDFAAFTYTFFKLRGDCHSPAITRDIVDMVTGSHQETYDRQSRVIQYPKTESGEPDRIQVETFIPANVGANEHIILSEVCYTCDAVRICRPFSTQRFTPIDPIDQGD